MQACRGPDPFAMGVTGAVGTSQMVTRNAKAIIAGSICCLACNHASCCAQVKQRLCSAVLICVYFCFWLIDLQDSYELHAVAHFLCPDVLQTDCLWHSRLTVCAKQTDCCGNAEV